MTTLIERARTRTIIADGILIAVLFISAGTLRWTAGWIYAVILLASTILPLHGCMRLDPGLIEERMSRRPDAKRWDWIFVALVGILTPIELLVPGLDYRWKWSPDFPGWGMWAGAAGVAIGTAGLIWAMRTNRFFSAVIRIQHDRGHQVVTSGPYRFVRHPGYSAWMMQSLSMPLLFRSVWTGVPVGILILMLLVRTELEDRVLKHELPGYSDYADRVKAKLVPEVW